ncbi:DUF2510 domain-containing protein [Mycobacterium sp. 23]|uniref:DUF2510 domain-containing protein n=1 Tax=Mycobacterium sp. 23 TaxID=3400424 RepID=UPI003AADA884
MEVAILLWLFCAAIGAAIAKSKNRHWSEGLLLGGLLGIIGVIIELFMRSLPPSAPPPGWYPDPEGNGNQRFWNGTEWNALPPAKSSTSKAAERTKKCPDCAETILAAAKVCKHCGYRYAAPSAPTASGPRAVSQGKLVKVKCHICQHVQTVPPSAATFPCEQCNAKLKRRTTAS